MSVIIKPSSSNNLNLKKEEEGLNSNKEEKIPLLLKLPPEIIDNLLSLVLPENKQLTTLSLIKVFPNFYEILFKNLWKHLIIYNQKQIWPLWKKLKLIQNYSKEIKSFNLKSWKGDIDILNNIFRLIPFNSKKFNYLFLNIGTNFSPDHLKELFENPRLNLKKLEMRFRPYVEQASYYQFLAGSYFDTAVETLAKSWPALPTFTHLSIVQDLPPRSTVPPTATNSTSTSLAGSFADLSLAKKENDKTSSDSEDDSGHSTPPTSISSASDNPLDKGISRAYTGHGPFGNPFLNEKLGITKPKTFAQPIVFFDINCIAKFGSSPVAQNLTHLRLRVPSRDLLRVLINHPRGSSTIFPKLQYLDISTTNVRIDTNLTTLLRTYINLEHLVLDHVNLFGFTAREKGPELCHDLGGLVVTAGLARGKERERQIAAWELEERTRLAEVEANRIRAQRIAAEQERIQNGGDDDDVPAEILAEIARRERMEEQQRAIELARSRRGHRSAAQSTFSIRDRSRRTGNSSASNNGSNSTSIIDIPPPDKLYMVLPPLPKLKSISIGGEASGVSKDKVEEWEKEFHQGWKEGLNKLLGWAIHIADKYERARRKADEWRAQEFKSSSGDKSSNISSTAKNGHISKSKRRNSTSNGSSSKSSSSSSLLTKPPLDIRLFRFPTTLEETVNLSNQVPGPNDLLAGLIEIELSESSNREYLDEYKQAIGDIQLLESEEINGFSNHNTTCVFCTVPDCEGPVRRGADGEKVDGRGGKTGSHKQGCGHLLGRSIWGYAGLDD
ncbi:uncharacterized protein I206_102437 [Kwoniella pini CBS 10737]|uniref:F-box domain-containing protein n=1 Tax=Kwoniella pini CBS 10737 TaxID=1296096 RepID=A0A1B9I5C6_9TREE|nr:uncharacterized protein I206_02786 [Kwoniella pini CBS 10737]OCF50730.1 hypothetical protein I206_02786 [Kwoniella pini CBS 10737]